MRRAMRCLAAIGLLIGVTGMTSVFDEPGERAAATSPSAPIAVDAQVDAQAEPTPAEPGSDDTGRDDTDRNDTGDHTGDEATETDPFPGARMPDLRVLPPSDLHVVDERSQGGSLRLKFTTVIWNDGEGPMEVWGDPSEDGESLAVEQVLLDEDGRKRPAGPVGSFDFEHRHGHLHLTSFARYELWTLDGGTPGELVAENPKVGFCLMDNFVVDEATAADDPTYLGCEAEIQGISPGYGDEYVAQLYEQDLEIGGLPNGRYRLVNVANPDGELREARLDNNAAHIDVVLRDGTVTPVGD